MIVWDIVQPAVMATSFVAVMMILVEYLNVLTRGGWQAALASSRWSQYWVAVLLGVTPGCLGAFVVVALYMHRTISFGAVVACMIATSGDEAFVMLAMFPSEATLLMLGIAGVGLVAGVVTDLLIRRPRALGTHHGLPIHPDENDCRCFHRAQVLAQLKHPSAERGLLVIGLGVFVVALLAGQLGPPMWNWIRITLLATGMFALFVVVTVPQHFLAAHLWSHVALQHVPRIFAWTLAALTAIALLERQVHVEAFIRDNLWVTLGVASIVGVVPESGPHLVFVTLYDHGKVPLSILAASSIVQDGHGMLPLFAYSWRDFLAVKGINLIVGILVGALFLSLGW